MLFVIVRSSWNILPDIMKFVIIQLANVWRKTECLDTFRKKNKYFAIIFVLFVFEICGVVTTSTVYRDFPTKDLLLYTVVFLILIYLAFTFDKCFFCCIIKPHYVDFYIFQKLYISIYNANSFKMRRKEYLSFFFLGGGGQNQYLRPR